MVLAQKNEVEENYLAFVSAAVSGRDELDHESPILAPDLIFAVRLGWGVRHQLESIVLGEHSGPMTQNVPITAAYPGQLKKFKSANQRASNKNKLSSQ